MNIADRVALAVLASSLTAPASAGTTKLRVKSFDGFELSAAATTPSGVSDADIKRVVVFAHGSGAQDMDEDLSAVSKPGTKNLFFVDVSSALVAKGFATVRYDKRSFEMARRHKADPGIAKSEAFRSLTSKPLSTLTADLRSFVGWAHERYPNAKIYLLGHSEGTYVSLLEAKDDPRVAGVALIGFFVQTLDTALVEQAVYRDAAGFDALDKDADGSLEKAELTGDGPLPKALRAQFSLLDLDGDGKIERSEFMAGNDSNFIVDDPASHVREYRIDEASFPRPAEIVRDAKFAVSIFQGELDNQTPSYGAKAVQILNRAIWKKPDLRFHYFPGLGHALDPRDSPHDVVFRPADPAALREMAAELDAAWKE